MNLNELSKCIYVLNLKEREDRKKHILEELQKIDCSNFKLIESVDGNSIQNPTKLKNGMFGLIQTYFKIYEDWKKENCDNILIIEDDCTFISDFNNKLKIYVENIPKNWEMMYFGGNHNYHMGKKTLKINDYCVKLNSTYSAHCLILKAYVFEDLILNLKKLNIENDVMLANLQSKYNAYSPSNKLTSQIPNFSNIEGKYVDYNWIIK